MARRQVRAAREIKSLRRIEVHPVFPDRAARLMYTDQDGQDTAEYVSIFGFT